jgi:TonB family protein
MRYVGVESGIRKSLRSHVLIVALVTIVFAGTSLPQQNPMFPQGMVPQSALSTQKEAGAPSAADIECSSGIGGNDTVEVLSDIHGVDFRNYLRKVKRDVRSKWYGMIPQSVLFERGRVVIAFAISKNGTVVGTKLGESSGNGLLDRAALVGIERSSPFPPLPPEFPGQSIALRMTFLYNADLKGVMPNCASVPAGASFQFSPRLRDVFDTHLHIMWSIVGMNCTGSICGTISDSGLYTAPMSVPDRRTIIVRAMADTDLRETASALVTIVPPEKGAK